MHCAACHGDDGKGNGPYAGVVDAPIPDITILARKNGGDFPFESVRAFIDGRQTAKAHDYGMPSMGHFYRVAAGEAYFDIPYEPETYVADRVQALTKYLSRIQLK